MLNLLNKNTLKTAPRSSDPRIRISRRHCNTINGPAIHLLGLKVGDTVSIGSYTSKEGMHDVTEWYLFIDPNGFPLCESKSAYLSFSSAALSKSFLDALNLPEKSYTIAFAPKPSVIEGMTAWGLILSTAK